MHTNAISTGVSNFHKMIVLKTTFKKAQPREMKYQNYTHFNEFQDEVNRRLYCLVFFYSHDPCDTFESILMDTLNKLEPTKNYCL